MGKSTPNENRSVQPPHPKAVDDVPEKRKREGCTTIAHLSDLHLTAHADLDREPWVELRSDLYARRGEIDVIAVTGDLIDGSIRDWLFGRIGQALKNASKFINELASAADVNANAVIAVPGNHDARIKGFLPVSRFKSFQALFEDKGRPKWFGGLNLFAYPFDSNESEWFGELAAGSVAPAAFTSLRNFVDGVKAIAGPAWETSSRVAFLHHHPMPIAATEHRSIENMEEFLLLRNAGMFMTELLHADVDLVLHGHKHYPSISKATYVNDDGSTRTLTVVASGSSGAAVEQPTYNILTLHEDGRINLQRRTRVGATYKDERPIALRSYEEARELRYRRTAKRAHLLDVHTYSTVQMIEAHSGDVKAHETYAGATSATAEPVDRVPVSFSSMTGYFQAPEHEPSSISWQWDQATDKHQRRGFSVFDPPIRETPVSFTRRSRTANAFHFSRRDRLDASGQESTTETVRNRISHLAERFAMAVVFPPDYFPSDVRLRVCNPALKDANGKPVRDDAEERYCSQGFHILRPSNTVVLNVLKPLLGYEYSFDWPLPEEDPSEPRLTDEEKGVAAEAEMRLIARAENPAMSTALSQLVDAVRIILPQAGADEAVDLEAALFAYDATRKGLVCICSNVLDQTDPILSTVVLPGRDIVGQAWRRRAAVLYTPGATDVTIYRDDGLRARTAILATPLLYPVRDGRRVAILSLASSSRLTPLLQLASNTDSLRAVATKVLAWWQVDVSAVLGLSQPFQTSPGVKSATLPR